jgi:hypothetical protein
MRYDDPLL